MPQLIFSLPSRALMQTARAEIKAVISATVSATAAFHSNGRQKKLQLLGKEAVVEGDKLVSICILKKNKESLNIKASFILTMLKKFLHNFKM